MSVPSSSASDDVDAAPAINAAAVAIRTALPPLAPLSLCWALSVDEFAASAYAEPAAFARLLLACEPDDEAERKKIMRFHFPADRHRALLARLALRALLARVLRSPATAPSGSIRLSRSAYGKPFVVEPADADQRVVFNLSHHGRFVVLAAEIAESAGPATSARSSCLPLLGCDVTTVALPHGASSEADFFDCFRSCFTDSEWAIIRGEGQGDADSDDAASVSVGSASCSPSSSSSPLLRFAWFWSLKESLIKAIGLGLSFELTQIEFAFSDPKRRAVFSPVSVRFRGEPKFEATQAAASSADAASSSCPSAAAASGSLSPPLLRPVELPASLDLTRDVRWTFASALTDDGQHVVSVCTGWKDGPREPQSTAAPAASCGSISLPAVSSSSSSALPSVESASSLSHLRALGRCISQTSVEAGGHSDQTHQLRVQQIRLDQVIPRTAVQ